MDEWREALQGLRRKYQELSRLCAERDVLEQRGVVALAGAEREERHARTRALAAEFPGALRELDGATVAGLHERLRQVEEVLALGRAREASPRWMRIVVEFHSELRDLLQLKGAKSRGEELTPEEGARIADPPYGRLQELVWTRLAQRHRVSPEELRGIVHGGLG